MVHLCPTYKIMVLGGFIRACSGIVIAIGTGIPTSIPIPISI